MTEYYSSRVNVEVLGSRVYKLLTPYIYTDKNIKVSAPAGLITDFISVPLGFFIKPDENGMLGAGIIHDYLYSKQSFYNYTRKEADYIFYTIGMIKNGKKWKVTAAYYAVRLFGWLFYKKK
ncbi:MAG: phage tail protein [Chloroflexi bacterium]|nr:MAG: phage tail protein [Chloroflexota bacterium]